MARALIKTFQLRAEKIEEIGNIIDNIWFLFDHDGSGVIEMEEFAAPDNFADTIIQTLNFNLRMA